MATIPNSRFKQLEFFEAHLGPWKDHAAEIGLQVGPVDELKTKTTATRAARSRMIEAHNAARAATREYNDLQDSLTRDGGKLVREIQFFARKTNNVQVYNLAQIPAPKTPTPVGAPGTPSDLVVKLLQGGALQLKWRCKNPAEIGTSYEISRQIDDGMLAVVSTTGERKFTDRSLPEGAGRVIYSIIAIRSTQRGNPGEFLVRFGSRVVTALKKVA